MPNASRVASNIGHVIGNASHVTTNVGRVAGNVTTVGDNFGAVSHSRWLVFNDLGLEPAKMGFGRTGLDADLLPRVAKSLK